jgi:hypothetical protein
MLSDLGEFRRPTFDNFTANGVKVHLPDSEDEVDVKVWGS